MKKLLLLFLLPILSWGQASTIGDSSLIGSGSIGSIVSTTSYPVTIPSDATSYTSLEQVSGWETDSSSDVSPNPPSAYAIVPTGGGGSTMTLETTGTSGLYTGWMAKKTISTTSQYNFLMRISYNFSSISGIQAWEVGRRATNASQITDNGQTQLVPLTNGLLEFDIVVAASGDWQDTGIRFPMFVIGVTNDEELYWISDPDGALSLMYVSLNGTLYTIPSEYQHVPGKVEDPPFAANEAVVAFQPDANKSAVSYNAVVTMNSWLW